MVGYEVLVIDKRDGKIVGKFESAAEAARSTGVPVSTVKGCASRKTLLKHRFFFRFACDWNGSEVFDCVYNRPVIATKEIEPGRRLVTWFTTSKTAEERLGTIANEVGNAIRKGYKVRGWSVRYALDTDDWRRIATPKLRSQED